MEELSEKDEVFKIYPNEKEAGRRRDFTLYHLGGEYLGAGKLVFTKRDDASGILLAYSAKGEVVFRGGLDYYRGVATLGQISGSFQRAREHRGHQIGKKMAVVGLDILKSFLDQEELPLEKIGLVTKPGSSMAKIAEFIGMSREGDTNLCGMSTFPDLEETMGELGIEKL